MATACTKKRCCIKFIPIFSDGTLDLSQLNSIITHKTKMVSVIHVSNAIGTHVDIVPIIARAHAVGARILIDAAAIGLSSKNQCA